MGKKNFKRKINPNEEQANLYDKITFIETKIINKINNLKKLKNSFNLCDHLHKFHDHTDFDPTVNYFDRFWKQYAMTLVFMKKMEEFQAHVQILEQTLLEIQKKFLQREKILDLPALAKLKKPISKSLKLKVAEKQEEKLERGLVNHTVKLKKEEEVDDQMINSQSAQNHIFQNE